MIKFFYLVYLLGPIRALMTDAVKVFGYIEYMYGIEYTRGKPLRSLVRKRKEVLPYEFYLAGIIPPRFIRVKDVITQESAEIIKFMSNNPVTPDFVSGVLNMACPTKVAVIIVEHRNDLSPLLVGACPIKNREEVPIEIEKRINLIYSNKTPRSEEEELKFLGDQIRDEVETDIYYYSICG